MSKALTLSILLALKALKLENKPMRQTLKNTLKSLTFILVGDQICTAESPQYSLTYEPMGFCIYPIQSRGGSVSYKMNDKTTLNFSHCKGSHEELLAKIDGEVNSLKMVYDLNQALNLHAGTGIRTISSEYHVRVNNIPQSSETRSVSAIIELGIGSKVHIGPATISALWAASHIPVYKITETDDFPSNADPGERHNNADAIEKTKFLPSTSLFRFSMGVNF